MKEIKVSPKFKTRILSGNLPNGPKIKELQFWCDEFIKTGLMPFYGGGSYGNLSFRTREDEFVITASGMKDPSSGNSFVTVSNVDLDEKTVYAHGEKPPSSESMLHYMIYRKRKDVNAIFHGHCERVLKHADKMGVPITLKEEPYGTIELAKTVLKIIDDNDFLIMKGHGFISLGKSLDKAGKLALKVIGSMDKKKA
jgi:ribulose-5-phosphate 4-epimerase/fuculose-1-phosphate aldolase